MSQRAELRVSWAQTIAGRPGSSSFRQRPCFPELTVGPSHPWVSTGGKPSQAFRLVLTEPGALPDFGFFQIRLLFLLGSLGPIGGIQGRLTASTSSAARPAASLGQAALPGPKALPVPSCPDFPKQKWERPHHLTKSRLVYLWGKTGLKRPVSLGGGQAPPHRPLDDTSLLKH